jgi:hypothetical protein
MKVRILSAVFGLAMMLSSGTALGYGGGGNGQCFAHPSTLGGACEEGVNNCPQLTHPQVGGYPPSCTCTCVPDVTPDPNDPLAQSSSSGKQLFTANR